MRVTLLGTGTSTGIPVIGCSCPVCTSPDPRDRRLRCSCLVEAPGISVVIDTGPDFRRQALRQGIRRVDAVVFSHHHFDHVAGLDDLRPFSYDSELPIPCYARSNTADILRTMFSYVFEGSDYPGVSKLQLQEIHGPFVVTSRYGREESLHVTPVEVLHGDMPMFGYRFGRFAYITDTSAIPETSLALLQDLDVLVLDALRERPHPTHLTIQEAVDLAQRIGARQTYLIHMTHTVPHASIDRQLPDHVNLGYDGLAFDVPDVG